MLEEFYRAQRKDGKTSEEIQEALRKFLKENEEFVGKTMMRYNQVDSDGIFIGSESVHNPKPGGYEFSIQHPYTGEEMKMPSNGYRFPESTFLDLRDQGKIIFGDDETTLIKIKKYLSEYQEKFSSVIAIDGRLGTNDLKRLFGTSGWLFDKPKPVSLLKRLISFSTQPGDVILDLFAGSGTTCEAVIELNKQRTDLEPRKCVLIQFPELVPEDKPAFDAGYKTIADICKDRIRKAQQAALPDVVSRLQTFSLAKAVFSKQHNIDALNEEEYFRQMELELLEPSIEHSECSLLTEIALEEGFSLLFNFTTEVIVGSRVHFVSNQEDGRTLIVVLEKVFSEDLLEKLEVTKKDHLVCFDSALSDTIAANLSMRCNLRTL